jgi:MoaA/NifB/PqqE/SkfB family radical SAM enzyme
MRALGVQKVDLAGGEPLVASALPAISDAIAGAGVAQTITTSGAGSNHSRRWLVDECARFARVIVSIDGPRRIHDELRGRTGTFDTALSVAGELRDAGGHLRVNTVTTSALSPAYVSELAEVVIELGPLEWCLIQPHPANAKPRFNELALADKQFDEVVAALAEAIDGRMAPEALLTRRVADYATYWVLYPDGRLRQHTGHATDTGPLNFTLDGVPAIVRALQSAPIRLPAQPAQNL